MESFDGVPVTNDHPPVMLTDKNAREYTVGSLQGMPKRDDDHLRGRLAIYDGDTIEAIHQGRRQVSLGYTCDLIEEPGTHPQYGDYDAKQTNIRGNHVAVVDTARAGSTACVRLDAAEMIIPPQTSRKLAGILGMPHRDWSDESRAAALEARKASAGATAKAVEASKIAGKSGKSADHVRASAAHIAASHAAIEAGNQKLASQHDKDAGMHAAMANRAVKRGDALARSNNRAKIDSSMAIAKTKKQGGEPAEGKVDPEDLASRNARGETAADPDEKAEPGPGPDDTDEETREDDDMEVEDADDEDEVPDDDDDDDDDDEDESEDEDEDSDGDDDDDEDEANEDEADDEPEMDAYDSSYDDSGELTEAARHKMSSKSFAVPEREGLPIHDAAHVRAAMSRFDQFSFKDPEEKHAASNRICARAKEFGVSSDGFERKHRDTLDRADAITTQNTEEKTMKVKELKAKLVAAQKRADAAEGRADALAKKVKEEVRKDADDEVTKRVDAKVALLSEATATGAPVDAKMSEAQIKRTVVKHVDSLDIPADRSIDYVTAYYETSLKNAKERADAGKSLDRARVIALDPKAPHNDASDDFDEDNAYDNFRDRSANAWANNE